MKRREFITLLGGAALAWPLAARAQQGERIRRVGVLMSTSADDPESRLRTQAFAQGLQQAGWTIDRNLHIDTRWGSGEISILRAFAVLILKINSNRTGCSIGRSPGFSPFRMRST